MRHCPDCKHEFADPAYPPAQCPACGRQFTVSEDIGATIQFDSPAPPPSPAPASDDVGATLQYEVEPGAKTTAGDDIGATMQFEADPSARTQSTGGGSKKTGPIDESDLGTTIQAGRWAPSPAEMADAAGAVGQTFDLGITPPNLRDLTMMWEANEGPPSGTALGGPPASGITVAAPFGSVASSGAPSGGRPPSSGQPASGGVPPSGGRPPSSHGLGSRGPSGGRPPQSRQESLEQSLVIQSRVLRDEASPGEEPSERIDFSLLKKLGEGGMGIVYAARQSSIRRTVALKMLKIASAQQASQRENFLAEAVITGDLEHPNIVPIYDLGRDEAGAIFYAMKHVKGTPWDKLIKEKSIHENVEILLKVADGVAFAHSRGVIHRDLKPENVMLGDFGEVLVMDWGLALLIENTSAAFRMGGTPAYMAPEMAFGPITQIGRASDVYLLGAILYEIITGHRPHTGSTMTRCLMSASQNEIVPTQKTGELVDIALKAMATKPEDRYPGVREFQDAIREYQSHTESIALTTRAQEDLEEARRTDQYDTFARALFAFQESAVLWRGNSRAQAGAVEAALAYAGSALRKGDYDLGLSLLDPKNTRHAELIAQIRQGQSERESRQRRLRTARQVGMGLVATILLIVTGAFFWIRAEAARARAAEVVAVRERGEAIRQRGVAEEQRGLAEQQRAKAVAAQQEEQRQREFAEEQQAKAVAAQQEEQRQREVAEEQRSKAIAAQKEEQRQREVADQQRAKAVAAQREEERQRQVAEDARKKEEYEAYVARLGLAAAKIEENAFDHAQALLAECPPALRNWEWGRLSYLCSRDVKSYDIGQPLEALAVSPDGRRFAAGGWGGAVRVFSVDSGEQLAQIATGAEYVFALAFSPDGTHLAIGSNAKPDYLSIWDAATGNRLRGLPGHRDAVLSVAYSRDGSQLLTGSYDSTARLWDLKTDQSREFAGHDWWIWSAVFSPDERRILTTSQDGSAIVWSVETGEASPPFLGHGGPVYAAAFSPDGKSVATGGYDKRVLVWRPDSLRPGDLEKALAGAEDAIPPTAYVTLEAHTAGVRSVQFSKDGNLLLSSGNDNTICVWDVPSHRLLKKLRGHASRVSTARFVPGDDRVLSAGHDHFAKLWSISKYEEVRVLGGRVLKGHRDSILGAAFSPDGETVVTASRDRTAIAWNVATGKQQRSYDEGHAYLASAALFFPDGKRMLTAAVDNTTRVWDVSAGTQIATLVGTGPSAAVALASDGSWIVTGSDDQSIKIWEPTGKLLRQLEGFKSDVTSVAISPDDRHIFTGDAIGRCSLLRADNGDVVWEARTHSRAITSVSFLPGGKRVLTASLDNSVGQWDVATGREDTSRVLRHPDAITSLAVSPDGRLALTACADKLVRLWDIEKAQVLHELATVAAATSDVAFSPDGRRALTTSADNRLRLWDVASGREIHSPTAPQAAYLDLSGTTLLLWAASFSASGDRLLTVGGAEAHLWDAATGKPLMAFSPQSAVSSVQFSGDGKQLVTGSWDNAARIWNSATGAALVKLDGVHTRFVNASVFSPDGTQVLTASDDKTVRLWDAVTGKLVRDFLGHEGRVTDVAFSRDGKTVLSASDDKTARLWDAASGKLLHVLRGHTQGVLCAEFSSDGRRVITGSDDTTARLWDAASGEPLPIILAGHTSSVTAVAFTPDGARALSGSKDITTKLWDPATGKEILTLTGHTQEITAVAVSPLGDRVLTGSRDGIAIIWLADPWQEKPAKPLAKK